MPNLFRPTRRAFLGQATVAAFGLSLPGVSMATTLSAGNGPAPQKIRFDAGDSFVVGHLYLPDGYSAERRHPAVVIGGSLTAVKEQMGGIYAIEMARRGFLALAIDYRHYGESGGEPRQYENPESKAEDLVAAVSYLAARPDVRPSGIGLLGICTSGGTVLYAAARDRRIAAIASVASHLAEPSITPLLYGGPDGVARRRAVGRAAREEFQRSGRNALIPSYHDSDQSASHVGPMPYYMDKARGGGVAQWTNALSVMSWEPWLDFDPVSQAAKITAPALIVHSDGCALPDQARKVHGLLQGPKTLHWTSGDHFAFYDGPDKVREAADVTAAHFRRHFA
ncbi:alpha/beta hydrolase [Bosea caraganae]|uniref:Alpha/beta hydrolase n=1 Tax=Bosea caraganae TaxID=2763117 RepID=A0A370L655_9HYPH|nr:CocE/NonD family hydrolase [Bosea caraganae]RDJ23122.1 alpha/beta hydrolase [Bosea caraganae]RDJ24765.1 alpha/beta hydrolase [Bosea caraganae]